MLCNFQLDANAWKCEACNRRIPVLGKDPPRAMCKAYPQVDTEFTQTQYKALKELESEIKDASVFQMPVNWKNAVVEWYRAGMPVRTDGEVSYLLNTFCQTCEKYATRLGMHYCRACGCNVNRNKFAPLNALRMATKACPENKFPAKVQNHRTENENRYVSVPQLMRETLRLIPQLPPMLDAVAGSARSGLMPATALACALHLPLYSVDDQRTHYCGHGWRLKDFDQERPKRILLIEDTVYQGRTIERCRQQLAKDFPGAKIITAAVYCHPRAVIGVDYYAVELPGNHSIPPATGRPSS